MKRVLRLWLVFAVAFFAYVVWSYQAADVDDAVLASDDAIEVVDADDQLAFTPRHAVQRARLVFLPGAMVDPKAYAPLARSIAERGYAVQVLKLPLRGASGLTQRHAVIERVAGLLRTDPRRRWVVAGHSLGGALASRVALEHAPLLAGLVLIGTTHPRDFDLSALALDVTKVWGSRDGVARPEHVKASAARLPPQTHWVEIAGGNHSQFGHYGWQLGDRRAAISRAEQQDLTRQALIEALQRAARQ